VVGFVPFAIQISDLQTFYWEHPGDWCIYFTGRPKWEITILW